MIEVLKQMQKALREYHYYTIDAGLPNQSMLNKGYAAYQAGLKAIAELESQEPVAWRWKTHNGYAYSEQHYEGEDGQPLFTHPPQRKPLTDEQVEKIIKANMSFQMNLAGIRQDFEAAYGIKE